VNTSLSIALTLFLAAPIAVARGNYSIENIEPPPTKHGTSQIDGMCFTKDGKLAVCLPCGEIWLRDLKAGTWSLFAEGLHTPLGIIPEGDNGFIVTQRPELTLIKDTDGDGTADSYLCLSDEFGMTGNYHEFNFTPVRNENGDIFFGLGTASSGAGICDIIRGTYNANGRPGRMHSAAPYRGWIMKYSPLDGSLTPWSSGHRTPNGLGFDLEGKLYATDNQGDWVGTSKLFHVQQGNFYGHAASLNWKPEITTPALNLGAEKLDSLRTRAAVLLPQGTMANSPTEPLVDSTKGAFGPFSGQLFLGEMNQARLMRVLLEEVDGQMQGACVPFYDKGGLSLGTNRMAFAPDGSLYLGQTKHSWAGGSGIQRIVWDKKTPMDILSMNLTEKGFKLTFTKPLEPQARLHASELVEGASDGHFFTGEVGQLGWSVCAVCHG
jgi:glucose/arabinose dehydrogenase